MKLAIIGTGNVAKKLGALASNAGYEIVYGTHNKEAVDTSLKHVLNEDACRFGDIVIFAIPFTAYVSVLPTLKTLLADKIVVDASNPLNEDWSPLQLGESNSAGETVSKMLPESNVVKAFNTVFADIMTPEGLSRSGKKVTAFIASDKEEAATSVAGMANDMGFMSVITGPMQNARYLEAVAHLNIQLAVGQGGGTDAAFIYVN